nr:retrovirus-related Pol polyprotein from transposon TNT 1-94 [Tanacetum cinerariifolium]
MLNKENYVPWSPRLLWYAKSRPNGKLIHNSILNGPYVRRMIAEPAGSESRPPLLNKENYVPWSSRLLRYAKSRPNGKLIHKSILNGPYVRKMIPEPDYPSWSSEDIYAAVDSCEIAQEIWLRKEVDELKAERLAKTQDPLALMANSNNPYAFPATHQDQSSFNQNYLQQPMPNPKDITNPTTAMNTALTLMAKAFKLNYLTPTNNNQRISSNPWNRQIAQPGMNMGQDRQMQIVGGNDRNQFRQYAGQNTGNPAGYNDVIGNQNQIGNGNLVAARAEGNADGQNGNQIRCYNCRGKEEAGIQLQAEEYDLMAAVDLDEIEEVNANCILMANLQQASTSGTQTDNTPVYDIDGSAEVHENCDDNEIFNMFTQEEQYTELLEPIPKSHQVPQNDNDVISEDTSVEQGGETVEQHPANFKETRALYESLYQNLTIEVEKVNLLFKKVSDQKDNTQDTSANTKFAKQPIVENLPKAGKTNALSNPVTSNSVSTPQESKGVNNDKVIAPRMFRINPDKTSREAKKVPNTVRASNRIKPITVSQPHIITNKDVNYDLNGLSSIGVDNTKTRRPQPRSNTKNDRVPSTSKSSQSQNKEAEVEEHHRNLLISKNNKHISSAWHFCDSDLEVAFRRNACFVKNLEGVDLLKGDRLTNLYTINLHEMASASPICLMARLPKFKYHKEHLFPSCEQGKIKRASHPPKPVPSLRQRLHLLHTDLCGPMRIASINGKRYVLVIVDDYSRYTWVHFLRSKDEAPEVIIKFLKRITVLLQSHVIIIRTDNDIEFKNQVLKEYFDTVGISHQMSSIRTPQQNRVVKRRNRTLVEAARTMLIFSHAPVFLWAEAIATACFTQNRSIIHRRFNKTPYELINGKKPDISFLHVFGALCYPKNDREDIGKLGAKGNIGFFIGYSADSCAYRVYNRRTKKIMETMNVSFDVLSAMAFEQHSSKPGLNSMTSGHISSGLDLTYAPSTITTQQPSEGELDLLFEAMYDDYIGGQPSVTTRTVLPTQEPQVRQTSTTSTTIADTAPIPTNSSSLATNILITSQDVDELNPNAMVDGNTFVNLFANSSTSAAASSSQPNVDPS